VSTPAALRLDPLWCAKGSRIAVAYSGGLDSTALLLAARSTWSEPGQVVALHVNHGLQAAALEFEAHCLRSCEQLGLPCKLLRVNAHALPGQSPEDAARRARYQALAQAAQAVEAHTVLLAQHADDQLESIVLALSRGAGLSGLAGMAPRFERHGTLFVRPWLQIPKQALSAWLESLGVGFVNDPSNSDIRYTRNHIRAEVLPVLQAVFPQALHTFARTAAHAAQAQSLLDEVAAQDLGVLGRPPVIKALQALSPARQINVLRHWLKTVHHTQASSVQMAELQKQIAACQTRGHHIHMKVGAGWVQRQNGALTYIESS
jgi:tRNA(Ile)-lysidine synthase